MGADCCNESKQDDNIVGGGSSSAVTSGGSTASAVAIQKDLPTISLDGKDAYEKFELSLPFYRTNLNRVQNFRCFYHERYSITKVEQYSNKL